MTGLGPFLMGCFMLPDPFIMMSFDAYFTGPARDYLLRAVDLALDEDGPDLTAQAVFAPADMLAARIVPPVGGHTDLASARAAWAGLPADRQAAREGLTALHRMTLRDAARDKGYKEEDKQRHVVTHPLVRANPVNGRKALYVGAHAQEIVGMPPEEGASLIDELTAWCTQPQYVYSHHWRDGDAVLWDNRCTLHRATPFETAKYKRMLHRTTIAGKSPDSAFATVPGA